MIMYCWSYLRDKELKNKQNSVHSIAKSDEGLSTPKDMDELLHDFVVDAVSGISRDISEGLNNGRKYSSFDVVYSLVESLSQFRKQMAGQEKITDKIDLFCASINFVFERPHSLIDKMHDFEEVESQIYKIMNCFIERKEQYGIN